MNKQKLINEIEKVKFNIPNNEYKKGYNNGLNSAILCVYDMKDKTMNELINELINELKKQLKEPSEIEGSELDFMYNLAIERTITLAEHLINNQNTPTHYQGTIQPIELINAQNLNFNLGNVVKYVCRAGKKQGENILTDLEKAKDYINFEIERVKQWTNVNAKN